MLEDGVWIDGFLYWGYYVVEMKFIYARCQGHAMYCYDLEVIISSPDRVKLGVCSTSFLSRTWAKDIYIINSNLFI